MEPFLRVARLRTYKEDAMKRSLAVIIALLLSGCAMQLQTAAPEKDARAKSLAAPQDKALVYFVRPGIVGKPFAYDVICDNVKIGGTCGGYFAYAFLTAGKHVCTTRADNTATLELDLSPGKTYYVEQPVSPGLIKGFIDLKLLDAAEGKQKLSECTLSADNAATP